MKTQKMTVGLFDRKNSNYSSPFIMEINKYNLSKDSEYILLSSKEEVEFQFRHQAVVVNEKVEYLRAMKAEAMAEFDEKISKLLALEAPEQEEDNE